MDTQSEAVQSAASPPDAAPSILRVRGPRASTVITQHFPADHGDTFLAWQREVATLAGAYPGYQATEVYPPAAGGDDWVIILHFDDQQTLQNWLDAPERKAWLARLPEEALGWQIRTMPTGFGSWFAGLTDTAGPLPHWKSFMAVLFALYPMVVLLSYTLSPQTARFGPAVAILIGNVVSVGLLEWVVMPLLNRALRPWLRANDKAGRIVSFAGLALMVGALIVLVVIFHFVGG